MGDNRIIKSYRKDLYLYTEEKLKEINGLSIIGNSKNKASIISFILKAVHPHDVGTIVNQFGVAIRTGHHCTMPIMDFYKIPATNRVSFGIYTTVSEINQLIYALKETNIF